jgi:hypothetical protein
MRVIWSAMAARDDAPSRDPPTETGLPRNSGLSRQLISLISSSQTHAMPSLDYCSRHACPNYGAILSRRLGRRAFPGVDYPTPLKKFRQRHLKLSHRRARRANESGRSATPVPRKALGVPDLFLEPSFSRGVHFVQYHSLVEVLNGYATQRRPKPYISS